MKKLSLLLILLVLIIFPVYTNAKKLENTCVYNGTYSYEKNGGLETEEVTVTCEFYDNNSNKCETSLNDPFGEDLQNWGSHYKEIFDAKDYYSKNKKCFDYLVFLDTRAATGISVFGANSYSTALSIASNEEDRSDKYVTSILTLKGLDVGSEADAMYDKIEAYTDKLNSFRTDKDPWNLDECLDDEGNLDPGYAMDKVCATRLRQMYDDLNTWDDEVKAAVDSGLISQDDERYMSYKLSVVDVRSQINEYSDDFLYNNGNTDVNVSSPDDDGIQTGTANCNSIFSGEFGKVLKEVLSLVRFVVPIIIIGLSIVDFIKATAAHDNSEIKKAANKLVKRMIVGVVIFLLPTLLEFILYLAGIEYGTCGIK